MAPAAAHVQSQGACAGSATACLKSVSHDGVESSLYVSPVGSDSNPGTMASPFGTLSYAQSVVRSMDSNMSGDIHVYLEGGLYRLSAPLVFGPQDSGTNGYRVIWSAAPGETAIVAGSKQITGWAETATPGLWSAPVPSGFSTAQLYVNGARAWETSAALPVGLKQTSYGYKASSPLMASWRNPSEIQFVYTGGQGQWAEPRCPIASIHGRQITMAQPCWNNSTLRRANYVTWGTDDTIHLPTSVANAYELLSRPGEFYVDRARHLLYYIPRPSEDMTTADVEAPVLEQLIEGMGSPSNPIHDVTFSDIQFSYATWLQPSSRTGYAEVQSGYTITGPTGYETEGLCNRVAGGTCPYGAWTKEPGAVQIGFGQNVAFTNDQFVHLGGAGLNLDDGSQSDLVQGCIFTDISGNGFELGGVDDPKAAPDAQTLNNTISDNHIYGIGTEYHGSAALLVGYAADTTITHNQIDHVPYSGISMGWGGWLDKVGLAPVMSYTHDNVISDNRIFDFLEVLGDGGGLYNVGLTGTSISNGQLATGNVIYDPVAWGWGLKSDDGSGFVTYSGNVLYGGSYNWGGGEPDTLDKNGQNLPMVVTNNYWQQGTLKEARSGIVQSGNTIISGPQDAPATVVASAGLEPAYQSLLKWSPSETEPPSPPTRVSVLYAFHRRAYVTWHPSFAEGTSPVSSYMVTACRSPLPASGVCATQTTPSVTIASGTFAKAGYAVVSGLAPGKRYSFWVNASNASGVSPPSGASDPTRVSSFAPPIPGPVTAMSLLSNAPAVRVAWYPPRTAQSPTVFVVPNRRPFGARRRVSASQWTPVLWYVLRCSNGKRYRISGLDMLLVTNHAGRGLAAFGGFRSGKRYTFSLAGANASGVGPFVSASIKVT